jgi:hypothetical protein
MEALKKQASKLREHVAKQQQVRVPGSPLNSSNSGRGRMRGERAGFEQTLGGKNVYIVLLLVCLLTQLITSAELLLVVGFELLDVVYWVGRAGAIGTGSN